MMAITIQEIWWFLVAVQVFLIGQVRDKRLGPVIAIMAFFVVDELGPPESGLAILVLTGLLIYAAGVATQEEMNTL